MKKKKKKSNSRDRDSRVDKTTFDWRYWRRGDNKDDQSLHPSRHAYSSGPRFDDVTVCYWCGEEKRLHQTRVVVDRDGKRQVIET